MLIIQPTSQSFQGGKATMITRLSLPTKDGGIMSLRVTGDLSEKITEVSYRISKNKQIVDQDIFTRKAGFNDESFAGVIDKIQNKLIEGADFLKELITAQLK